ncbi:substrate-binding domain-containing protein [Streptomyces sp. NPDC050610]|uniref:substrate-binding domain-containing protein n=1 Tax=Streptomyces sp. NPDC050610 TaxID=3157097 RepID=UPI003426531F
MTLPSTETILAAAGLLATALIWAVDRFLPGRKRIGYRVQMDTAIGMNPQAAHSVVQLRLLRADREISDATLALLRIENDGSKDIVRQDYQEPLTVDFAGRTIVGVEVPDSNPPNLAAMLTRNGGLRPDGSRLTLPRVPLNKRNHFKVLVLLSGAGTGERITLEGFLSGGRIVRNAQRRGPQPVSLALGSVFIILVGLLGGLQLSGSDSPPRSECASGRLTVTGSSAFARLTSLISTAYERQCPGAEITVTESASLTALQELNSLGGKAHSGAPARIAVSDGPAPHSFQQLRGQPAGVVIFSIVVNKNTGIHNLTLRQLRDIYAGKYRNWNQLNGNDQEIHFVSRTSNSGTRKVFEQKVLRGGTEPVASSDDCRNKDRIPSARFVNCELSSTDQLVAEVNRVPGAIGYGEMSAATKQPNVNRLLLDGGEPDIERVRQNTYPFWAVENFYTYGPPKDGSLTAKFLTYLSSDTAKNTMRTYGHVPCADLRARPNSPCAQP